MITTLELSNVTVFNNARLDFSPGLNVLIGENGTGKSHVLKLGYILLQALAVFKKAGALNEPSLLRTVATHERLTSIFGCSSALLSRNYHAEKTFTLAVTLSDGCRYFFEHGKTNSVYQPGSAQEHR